MQVQDAGPMTRGGGPRHSPAGAEFRRRFRWLIFHSWNIPPVFGLGFILLIGVLTPAQLLGILVTPLEPAYIIGWLAFALWFLPRSVQPLADWLDSKPGSSPEQALRAVQRFPLTYWATFIVYLVLAPVSVLAAAHIYTDFVATPLALFRIELVALIVSIIVGLPIFFLIFDLFGQALGGLELKRPIITVKTKVFLIGALVPLLIDTMLVQYYWTRTGFFTTETFGVWLLLEALAIGGSLIFAHSFGQSLGPLQKLIGAPRPLPEASIATLRPHSTDELGLLTAHYRALLRELHQRNETLELNNQLLRTMGGNASTGEVFNTAVGLLNDSIGSDLSFLAVYDPASNSLVGIAQTGFEYNPQGHFRLRPDEQSIISWVYRNKQAAVAADASNDPRMSPALSRHFGIRSAIAVPLKLGDEVLGVLMAAYTTCSCDYGAREQAIIDGLGREVALALDAQRQRQARNQAEENLHTSEKRLRLQQDALVGLAKHQAKATSDIASVLQAVTETVAATLDVQRASVWLHATGNTEIACLDLYDSANRAHSSGARLQESVFPRYFRALRENRVIAAADAHHTPETSEFSEAYLRPLGIGAMLDAPIHRAGSSIGVLCCEHVGAPREWAIDEQNFASAVADFVSLCLELNEHHITSEKLRHHREQLEEMVAARTAEVREQARIIDQIHDSVVTTDLAGIVTGWNKGAERLLGYTADEAIGRHIGFVYPPEEQAFLRDQVIAPLKAHGRHEVEVRMRRNSGEMVQAHLSLSMLYAQDGSPRGMVGYSLDIGERKRAEALASQHAEELATINRELEAFSYSVSHDLRAPLRAVDGFARALAEDYGHCMDGEAQDYLKRVRSGTQRMGQLIDDLLQLSRISRSSLNPVPVNLTAMAHSVMEQIAATAPDRKLVFEVAPGLAGKGDERLLNIAFTNLLDNAWKYTSKNGAARIEFGATIQEGQTIYYVRDNGVGFDLQYAGKLFGAFQRLHGAEFPGTGIGLATVARIIHRHGGRIWADGAIGQGATFFFTLGIEPPLDAKTAEG
jgi:PAS domain S-box-containing protein